ncbi:MULTISPECIES: TniQ family protein [Pseudoalteromonas]|uniref:TniQ family protein n=1 Tax=Pseudoalteromonas TaxID=53246 RepID=UPI002E2A6817|nr:TniQ family protein [Pseudoalteromonas galatheae]
MLLLPGESLHSLFLRYYMREGLPSSIHRTIITPGGRWRKFSDLKAPKFFEELKDSVRYEIIRESILVSNSMLRKDIDWISYNIVSSGYAKINLSDVNIFRNGKLFYFYDRVGEVKFCPICMRNSIKQYGVGYFKKEWFRRDNGTCYEHGEELIVLQSKSYATSSHSIYDVMMGTYPCNNRPIFLKNIKMEKVLSLSEHISKSAHCLWNELVLFSRYFIVATFKHYDLNNITQNFRSALRLVFTSKGELKALNWRHEVQLMKFMMEEFSIELISFLYKHALFSEKEKVMPDGSRIRYRILKFDRAKCDFCTEKRKECLSSSIIPFVKVTV